MALLNVWCCPWYWCNCQIWPFWTWSCTNIWKLTQIMKVDLITLLQEKKLVIMMTLLQLVSATTILVWDIGKYWWFVKIRNRINISMSTLRRHLKLFWRFRWKVWHAGFHPLPPVAVKSIQSAPRMDHRVDLIITVITVQDRFFLFSEYNLTTTTTTIC